MKGGVHMFGILGAGANTVDLSPITEALTAQLNVAQVATIIAAILGACLGLVILWFGARKLVNSIISAFESGRIHF
jgi:hypothetical protein